MTISKTRWLAAGLAATLLAGGAAAQTPPPGPPQGQAAERWMGGPRMDPAAMMQRRAEHLRAVLQLQPAQEPALNAFLAAMKPPEGRREAMRDRRREMAEMTTPQRLDAMRAAMTERQAAFDARAAATKRFYAQLTPAQQKAFDALRPHQGRGLRGGGMRGGHRGHGR